MNDTIGGLGEMYEQFSEVELGGWKPSCPAVLVACDPMPLAQFHSRMPQFVQFCLYIGEGGLMVLKQRELLELGTG